MRRIIAFVLGLMLSTASLAATVDGLVWMDSPCEGCVVVVKDLKDGDMRIIYMERHDDDMKVISVRKLACTIKLKRASKREYCDYKIITEYKKPQGLLK